MAGCRCRFPEGMAFRPDGIHEADPCIYEEKEVHTNATVIVCQCKNCGHISIEWIRTVRTEDIFLGDLVDEPEG